MKSSFLCVWWVKSACRGTLTDLCRCTHSSQSMCKAKEKKCVGQIDGIVNVYSLQWDAFCVEIHIIVTRMPFYNEQSSVLHVLYSAFLFVTLPLLIKGDASVIIHPCHLVLYTVQCWDHTLIDSCWYLSGDIGEFSCTCCAHFAYTHSRMFWEIKQHVADDEQHFSLEFICKALLSKNSWLSLYCNVR